MQIDLHQLSNGYQLPKKKWEYMTGEEKILYWMIFSEKVTPGPDTPEAKTLAMARATFAVPAAPEERQPLTIEAWEQLRATAFRYFLVTYPPRAEEFEDGIRFGMQADGKEWSIEINVSVKCGTPEPSDEVSADNPSGAEPNSNSESGTQSEDGSGA